MKKLFTLLLLISLFSSTAFADNRNTYVYITDTGSCYHNAGCSYLKSISKVTLEDAVHRGLRACSKCNPPYPDFSSVTTMEIPAFTPVPVSTPTPQRALVVEGDNWEQVIPLPRISSTAKTAAASGAVGYLLGRRKRK